MLRIAKAALGAFSVDAGMPPQAEDRVPVVYHLRRSVSSNAESVADHVFFYCSLIQSRNAGRRGVTPESLIQRFAIEGYKFIYGTRPSPYRSNGRIFLSA